MTGATQPIGYIFENIAIYEPSSIIKLIDTMTPEQAFYILNQAVQMAYSKNIYSLQESEILSKSLRTLSQTQNEKKPTE